MQDIEFTIQRGVLYMLQTRVGKRNGQAAIRIAVEMAKSRLITREEAILRVDPAQIDELLHPSLDSSAEENAVLLAKGLPAGPGGCAPPVWSIVRAEQMSLLGGTKRRSAQVANILCASDTKPAVMWTVACTVRNISAGQIVPGA